MELTLEEGSAYFAARAYSGPPLVLCAAQRRRQPFPRVFPSHIFRLDPLFDCGPFGKQRLGPLVVLMLRVVQGFSRFRHQLIAPRPLLCARRLLFSPLGVPPFLLTLEFRRGLT